MRAPYGPRWLELVHVLAIGNGVVARPACGQARVVGEVDWTTLGPCELCVEIPLGLVIMPRHEQAQDV